MEALKLLEKYNRKHKPRTKKYNAENLLKVGGDYLIPYGMRSNGKSYQIKLILLLNAFYNGGRFVYLRRYRDEIKENEVTEYFSDMDIKKITDGVYSYIVAWHGYIYFANLDDNDNIEKGKQIGRYCALNLAPRYKSQAFVNYDFIVYEEFITDGIYLTDEPDKLQQFVSTIARDNKVRIFLIGNTISRVCPYFYSWGLKGTLTQKAGTIEQYHQKDATGNETAIITVENCEVVENKNNMFFGSVSKQILSGEWDVLESPKLPKPLEDFSELYHLQIAYQLFTFNVKLLIDDDGAVYTFVYPAKKRDVDGRIISDEFSTNQMQTSALDPHYKAERIISDCFRNNKVCYSDNLTAADFKQVVNQFKFM